MRPRARALDFSIGPAYERALSAAPLQVSGADQFVDGLPDSEPRYAKMLDEIEVGIEEVAVCKLLFDERTERVAKLYVERRVQSRVNDNGVEMSLRFVTMRNVRTTYIYYKQIILVVSRPH